MRAWTTPEVRDYLRMALLKLPAAAERGEEAFADLADVLALAKRKKT